MNEQTEYLYYRDLFHIFKAYTTPKLLRVLDDQGIKYFTDAKGKPFTTRAAVEGALESSDQTA
jgi:predicted flavoprotein YhiN